MMTFSSFNYLTTKPTIAMKNIFTFTKLSAEQEAELTELREFRKELNCKARAKVQEINKDADGTKRAARILKKKAALAARAALKTGKRAIKLAAKEARIREALDQAAAQAAGAADIATDVRRVAESVSDEIDALPTQEDIIQPGGRTWSDLFRPKAKPEAEKTTAEKFAEARARAKSAVVNAANAVTNEPLESPPSGGTFGDDPAGPAVHPA